MNNRNSIATALAVAAIIGLGSLTLGNAGSPLAAGDGHGHEGETHNGESEGHANEESHTDEKHEEGHEGEGRKEAGSSEKTGADAHEEEGHIALSEQQIKAAGIETVVAAPRSMSTSITFPGEIRFDEDRTSHVVPRVSGVVEEVKADLGQTVKKGQVLAVIASQQISDLRSELNAAQRRLQLARLTLQREKKLWEDKISAEQDYLLARQAFEEAQISSDNARQKLAAIGASLSPAGGNRYELVAPFNSVVVEKHLGIGEVVTEATNAFILSDLSRVWATFGVAPKDLNKVVAGRAVTVSAPDLDARVQGTVGHVGSLLGEQSRAAVVRVILDNPQGAWRPGLFVSVDVSSEKADAAISLPETALQTVEDKTSVFIRNAEGFQLQPVTVGRRDGGYVEIIQGLAVGAHVAAAGSFILKSELGKGSAEHAH
jgi:cobalt-zinc-cadmium efflux system membrane fusion protein